MREEKVAYRYAKALFDTADEQGIVETVEEHLQALAHLFNKSIEFQRLVTDPLVTSSIKDDLFVRLFRGKVHQLVVNFLRLLASRRRERALLAIIREFRQIVEERAGIMTASVVSATDLTSEQKRVLMDRLSRYASKKVKLECAVDPTLRGGFIAKLGDIVFDGSVEARLEMLRHQIVSAR
jgi:F-type H+-transporting ATPase subunit delta